MEHPLNSFFVKWLTTCDTIVLVGISYRQVSIIACKGCNQMRLMTNFFSPFGNCIVLSSTINVSQ